MVGRISKTIAERAQRIDVSLHPRLIVLVDHAAVKNNTSRSAVIGELIKNHLVPASRQANAGTSAGTDPLEGGSQRDTGCHPRR